MHRVCFSLASVFTIIFLIQSGFLFPASARAEPRAANRHNSDNIGVEESSVELFDAIKSGEIDVKVIAKDASKGNVLIENKTQKRLHIRLPEALAAAPVLAQFNLGNGNGLNLGNGNSGRQNGAANQTLGVGMQGGNNGNNFLNGGNNNRGIGNVGGNPFGFPGGGIFDVEPEKVRKIKMNAVCLEHGKRNPNVKIEYRLIPLESYTSNRQTLELVKMLSSGEVDQKSAQAAAWHLENGMTWEVLAAKIASQPLAGISEPYFTNEEIANAKRIVAEADKRQKQNSQKRTSPSLADAK